MKRRGEALGGRGAGEGRRRGSIKSKYQPTNGWRRILKKWTGKLTEHVLGHAAVYGAGNALDNC